MDTIEIQKALVSFGWPIAVDGQAGPKTTEAIKDFQRGWASGPPLAVDGVVGPKTETALHQCEAAGGACAPHFRFAEFKSKGNGWIKVARELVLGLETLRQSFYPRGLTVVSGYRDPDYNAHTGGAAKDSQHMYGNAVDLDELASLADVRGLKLFSGIGVQRANGLVRHVDVRHVGPNTTNGRPDAPTIWYYG